MHAFEKQIEVSETPKGQGDAAEVDEECVCVCWGGSRLEMA